MRHDVFSCLLSLILCHLFDDTLAEIWPYNRHLGEQQKSGKFQPDRNTPEFTSKPTNHFIEWLTGMVNKDDSGQLQEAFPHGEIPSHVTSVHDLLHHVDVPDPEEWERQKQQPVVVKAPLISNWSQFEADQVFSHLGFHLDPRCTIDRNKWWYRTYDGSCNWLKVDEISQGQVATAKSRDFDQHTYADGISKPRDGPNPRAVSNAFFRRNKTIYYEHTPLLLGLIEFIMHDVTWSQDSSTEYIDVAMPPDETDFNINTTLRVWRTAAVPGTGTSKDNPREGINMATTWLDLSSLYGSTAEVAISLRSSKGGKLLAQSLTTHGRKTPAEYLPFNIMSVPTRTRPGVDPTTLFAGGDPRTNEDWVMLAVHTLLLREHNRLCDKLAKQQPDYSDERLYQTIRLVMSAKIQLIANAYQMAYWTDSMPWPRDDGFPLFRSMHDESFLDIGPANTYPWPLVTRKGKPMTVSAEMAVVYRFHEFIIPSFPIKDATNTTLWDQSLFSTGFNATGFLSTGLEPILRGLLSTSIPNFKSGVDESFRSAGKYRGSPFDIVTTSIVHEREQGLPTFNQYFTAYNAQDPAIPVKIRRSFSDFSSNPDIIFSLTRLYSSPDEVDLVVGVQLDEDLFPGTTIPLSAAITSLFSLFASGNSDRFSVGYAAMRCFLVDKPWDCTPSNALEELLWKPKPREGFPNFRWYDSDWVAELDLQAHGANLLWRLVAENSEVRCLQKRPLFPWDKETNPVVCTLESEGVDVLGLATTGLQVGAALVRKWGREVGGCLVAGMGAWWLRKVRR